MTFDKKDLVLFSRINPVCIDVQNIKKFYKRNKGYTFFGIFNEDESLVKNVLTGEIYPYHHSVKAVEICGEVYQMVTPKQIKLQYVPGFNFSRHGDYRIYFDVQPACDVAFLSSCLVESSCPIVSFFKNDGAVTPEKIKRVLSYFNNEIQRQYEYIIEDIELGLVDISNNDGRDA